MQESDLPFVIFILRSFILRSPTENGTTENGTLRRACDLLKRRSTAILAVSLWHGHPGRVFTPQDALRRGWKPVPHFGRVAVSLHNSRVLQKCNFIRLRRINFLLLRSLHI
ncbi:MAG: hypothetical protein NTX52_01760 [Planctomycetota bacterium]|nr:hypothetical protein [Planctomycetota bacterium]